MRRSELFTVTRQVAPLNCAPIALIKTAVLWLYSVAFASTALLYGLVSATYLRMQIITFRVRHSPKAKCILATAVCVSVCLSLTAFPHYCKHGLGCNLGNNRGDAL